MDLKPNIDLFKGHNRKKRRCAEKFHGHLCHIDVVALSENSEHALFLSMVDQFPDLFVDFAWQNRKTEIHDIRVTLDLMHQFTNEAIQLRDINVFSVLNKRFIFSLNSLMGLPTIKSIRSITLSRDSIPTTTL